MFTSVSEKKNNDKVASDIKKKKR